MIAITPIPAFNDNYHWLITYKDSSLAYIVDPGDGEVVHRVLQEKGLQLAGIFVTHHHYDHVDGIPYLLSCYQHDVPVYGPNSQRTPQVTHPVLQDDSITLFDRYPMKVIATPGHTQEHISYFCPSTPSPLLFSGDTLFAGGCGRLSGGSAEQLHHSLQLLSQLPDNTLVYCAHEYTLSNLSFALAVEPKNTALKARIVEESYKREQKTPTLPTSIMLEKQTNPFLRVHENGVKTAVLDHWSSQYSNDAAIFADLRRWKDQF